METQMKQVLTVESLVNATVEKVWEYWTTPEHIKNWNQASDDWHTTTVTNDLKVGGSFSSRMEAKDGSMGFDFGGVYDVVNFPEYIEYTLGDGRKVKVWLSSEGSGTKIVESFEAEETHPVEMQQGGWQAIMDSFKKYAETQR